MKKTLCTMLAALAAVAATADVDNVRITFQTPGPDRYQDGAKVLDGEFYALVWVADGASFRGFKADGALVATEGNALIAQGPAAKGGRLPLCKAEVTSAQAVTYANGSFKVVLLDTRDADGSLSAKVAAADGSWAPSKVNGCSEVAGMTARDAAYAASLSIEAPITIAMDSEVPEGTPAPVITGFRLRQGANGTEAVITVKGTVPYLNYCAASVSAGEGTAEALTDAAANGAANGGEVEIVVPANGKSGLFKVIRK